MPPGYAVVDAARPRVYDSSDVGVRAVSGGGVAVIYRAEYKMLRSRHYQPLRLLSLSVVASVQATWVMSFCFQFTDLVLVHSQMHSLTNGLH